MTLREFQRQFHALLRGHPTWRQITIGAYANPEWLGVLGTQIALLLGDETVRLFSGHLDLNRLTGACTGSIDIYTETRVLRAGVLPSDPSHRVFASAIARSGLRMVEILEGGVNLFSIQFDDEWPGVLRIRAQYPGSDVDIPGDADRIGDAERAEFVNAFLPSLLGDLSTCTRGHGG